ncbi:MAG: aldose 1-epimerase family protein [Lachnospiraceae bacterium]
MIYTLENHKLIIEIDTKGAELCSIINKENGLSYMWNAGDAWKRHSPVLFPIVGGIKDKTYRIDGREFHLNQHGFARDMEFNLLKETDTSLSFILSEDPGTLVRFPYSFNLIITYTLTDSEITVKWEVENTNTCEMHFSIGGHPAFTCPLEDANQTDCYLHFDQSEALSYNLLSENGLCLPEEYPLETENGYVRITEDFFDKDALVLYNDRLRSVALADSNKKDYLRVTFDAPVYGIWSAKGKHAPFVCIEPWYGRCDDDDFSGSWQERKFDNTLMAGGSFEASYIIEIL